MQNHFPKKIRELTPFKCRFEAYMMDSPQCETYFASYPAGTVIEAHDHDTENCGVITKGELILLVDGQEQRFKAGDWYHMPAHKKHAARFEVDTAEVEFWFKK